MRYLGGKKRQSKHIVASIKKLYPDFKVYVEPFCGALWSACAVMEAFPNRRYILNDSNPWLMTMWREVAGGWMPPPTVTEQDYRRLKLTKSKRDPMTAYAGYALSFAAKFYGGWARGKSKNGAPNDYHAQGVKSVAAKKSAISTGRPELHCANFEELEIPDGAMVYLDPPYEGRTKQSAFTSFDRRAYYRWARWLSTRCCVVATEFVNPCNWEVLHNFGDTVVRHRSGKGKDGTNELLMRVSPHANGRKASARRSSAPPAPLTRIW